MTDEKAQEAFYKSLALSGFGDIVSQIKESHRVPNFIHDRRSGFLDGYRSRDEELQKDDSYKIAQLQQRIAHEHHCVLTEDWNPGVSCEARAVGYDHEWEAENRDRLTAWIKLMSMVGYVDKGKKRTFG